MATYANPTNPFIKVASNSTATNGEQRRTDKDTKRNAVPNSINQRRNAPGTAASKRDKRRAAKKLKAEHDESLLLATDQSQSLEANGTDDARNIEEINGNNDTAAAIGELIKEQTFEAEVIANKVASVGCATEVSEEEIDGTELPELSTNLSALMIAPASKNNLPSSEVEAPVKSQPKVWWKDESDTDDGEADSTPADLETLGANQERTPSEVDSRQLQHLELINKLRFQLRDLERYAYERGELEQVPPSVLAERQSVILDTLMRKLPLNLDTDKIGRLELEELKRQVDKEISELLDPLFSKDQLLNQLKTQLTDLERYITHLHRNLGVERSGSIGDQTPDCSCSLHGCAPPKLAKSVTFQSLAANDERAENQTTPATSSLLSSETLPKTSRLIRGLMAQLICSDIKIQEAMKMQKDYSRYKANDGDGKRHDPLTSSQGAADVGGANYQATITKAPQFHDSAIWTMHLDRVVLATDSLTNLYASERPNCLENGRHQVDGSLVDSVVRRQLVPALRDLLAYGLIDPNSATRSTYRSFFFDPYFLISSLTCLPGSQSTNDTSNLSSTIDKLHVWNVIEDYFKARYETEFAKSSSVKTLSQSFNLTPSMDGPMKVTSKQALLIAIDDIIERLSRCKPNGPESHFKLLVYTALNQGKLATWLRIIFRNKSILKQYYHNFGFVSQAEKMEKFFSVIEALARLEFSLNTDTDGSVDQFVSAF